MKKLLTAKHLSLILLLSLLGSKANAWQDDGGSRDSQCCESSCYECGCNPLYCGAWDLQVQGGVNPILWRNRGNWLALNCSASTPLISYFETPKFSHLYRIPWIVGGQVGYAMSDNTRVYLEFNYSQANHKNNVGILAEDGSTFTFGDARKYKLFDAYAGARYYWDRWCDRVSFFLGGKVGLTHHKRLNYDFNFASGNTTPFTDQNVYRSNTVISGGANVGFDICFCGNWSFVVTGEVVGSCGPRSVGPVATVATGLLITQLVVGSVGNELRFPVTAAIRYSF